MWTSTRRGEGGPAHVDACGQWGGGGQKRDFFVDIINGWPLTHLLKFYSLDDLRFEISSLSLIN